ncbi:MAG: hypothetical protein V1701_00245 [Planctomycetota bacterium]
MRRQRTKRPAYLATAIVMLVAAVSFSRADIAPEPLTTGGTSLADKNKSQSVKMAWEEVDIYPSPEKNKVVALFGMKNESDKDAELEVGFPSYFEVKLNDFELEIDGNKQSADVKKESLPDSQQHYLAEKDPSKRIFTYWMCWNMKFSAGKEHQIKVSYWVKTERISEGLWIKNLTPELKAKLWPYRSGYVLRTGADWAGNIGKAIIRLHYNDAVKKPLATLLSHKDKWQYDEKTDIDTLTLIDFKPNRSSDIEYSYKLCTASEEAKILAEAIKDKKLDPWAQEHLLQLIEDKNNSLKLPDEEKNNLVIETLEWMVPPVGPEVDQAKITRGAEAIVQKAYQRLFKNYLATAQDLQAASLASYYQRFIKFMLDRDIANKTSKWVRVQNEYSQLEQEYRQVTDYINNPPKKDK